MTPSVLPLARRALLAGLFAFMPLDAAAAQLTLAPVEHATFFVTMRGDTIIADRVARTPDRLTGDFLDRLHGARIAYAATLNPDALVTGLTLRVFRRAADTIPVQETALTFAHDSVRIVTRGTAGSSAPARTRTIAVERGAMPYINPSPGMVEQILRRSRASGDSAPMQLVEVMSGTVIPARVQWVTPDSAMLVLAGVAIPATMDAAGHLQRFTVPIQGVVTTRVEGDVGLQLPTADYSAPPGAPYTAESVQVHTAGGITLGGTLTMPAHAAGARVPAVVTITGSGPEDRDEAIPVVAGYRPFRDVADTLGRRGIAVLRLDDRGVGESEAGPPGATSADFASDIESALAYLRTRPDIDASRLGLVGHSEGGMIAPMVAARDTGVRAIVLLAGPGKRGFDVSMEQNRYLVERAPGLTAAQRDSVLASARVKLDSLQHAGGWTGFWLGYDPLATARQVSRAHVLILQGATDRQVMAEQADALAKAFRRGGNRDVTVRVFPSTNHLFLADSSGDPAGYGRLADGRVRRDVLGEMSDWLVARMGVSGGKSASKRTP